MGIEDQKVLNLVDPEADQLRNNMVELTKEKPSEIVKAIEATDLPDRHDVRKEDINMNRLASVLDLAYNREVENFEELVDLHNVGPRTLKALAMASEVIHGDATRFDDPARFSFAVGGKDGRPHPIDTKAFDETVEMLLSQIGKLLTDKAFQDEAGGPATPALKPAFVKAEVRLSKAYMTLNDLDSAKTPVAFGAGEITLPGNPAGGLLPRGGSGKGVLPTPTS